MHLHDGRVIDLSDLTIDQILALLAFEQVRPEMVKATYHFIPKGAIPVIVCPRCGRSSANTHDIEQKYCGACHQCHEFLESE